MFAPSWMDYRSKAHSGFASIPGAGKKDGEVTLERDYRLNRSDEFDIILKNMSAAAMSVSGLHSLRDFK